MIVTCSVYGRPATKGSTVSFLSRSGKVVTRTDSAHLVPWTDAVRWSLREAGVTGAPSSGPVLVTATFVVPKPKRTKATLPITRPDLDKWARALLDALTGLVYADDSQVVNLRVDKMYGTDWATHVAVEALT